MTVSAHATVLVPVLEDELDAAAALVRTWDRALASPRYTIAEVAAGPEERLLGNLEGLALDDAVVVEKVLLPALESEDAERAFVATISLLEGGGESCAALLERLNSTQAGTAVRRALGLTSSRQVEVLVRGMLTSSQDPARLAAALEVLAFRQASCGPEIGDLLCASEPVVLEGALRAARGQVPAGVPVRILADKALQAAATQGVRDAAMELGLLHGSRLAWSVAQKAVEAAEVGAGAA